MLNVKGVEMLRFVLAATMSCLLANPVMAAQPKTLLLKVGNLDVNIPFGGFTSFRLKDGTEVVGYSVPNYKEEIKLASAIKKYGSPLPASEVYISFRHLCDNQGWGHCLMDGAFPIPLDSLTIKSNIPNLDNNIYVRSSVSLRNFGISDDVLYEIGDKDLLCRNDACTFFLAIRGRATIEFNGFIPRPNNDATTINDRALHYINLFLTRQMEQP